LRLLSTIGYQVGIAIERARLAEESVRRARAEERTRLAREIHDTLVQDLTAIGLHLEGALRHLEDDPVRARDWLERALATSRQGLEDVRRSVLDLRAAPLAGRSLADALAALGRTFTSETGVRVHVRCRTAQSEVLSTPRTIPLARTDGASGHPGPAPRTDGGAGTLAGNPRPKSAVVGLPLRVEVELYAIVEEALANVRKHAHAREVEVTLKVRSGEVRLTVQDDGQGFAAGSGAGGAGYGLQGMRERARLLGGTLRVRSRPGHGTRVTVVVPLETEREDLTPAFGHPSPRDVERGYSPPAYRTAFPLSSSTGEGARG
jgi:two-component system NarL family sensor kinase